MNLPGSVSPTRAVVEGDLRLDLGRAGATYPGPFNLIVLSASKEALALSIQPRPLCNEAGGALRPAIGKLYPTGITRQILSRVRAGLAQLVEQRFCKPKVGGSSPSIGTKFSPAACQRIEKSEKSGVYDWAKLGVARL